MRILFVTANRLGDAVLSTGLLDHLIRAYPQARITIACGPIAAGIFARMPNLDRIIIIPKQTYARHWLPLWRQSVTRLWDLVVDIRGSALSWVVPTRRRAIMRGGRSGGGPKIGQLARVLRLTSPPLPVAWFSAEDMARVSALLPPDRPIVVLAPTANWAPKVWPAERFVALFHRLRVPNAVPVVIAGPGAAEAAMARPVLEGLPEAIDLVDRLILPEIAACLSRAALFVGNDSGLMHLAAAAGAPTLGLFGPTNAVEYAPAGLCTATVVGEGHTMDGLSLDAALSGAERILGQAVRRYET